MKDFQQSIPRPLYKMYDESSFKTKCIPKLVVQKWDFIAKMVWSWLLSAFSSLLSSRHTEIEKLLFSLEDTKFK